MTAGKMLWTRVPKANPVMAPMKRDGANMPPEPPEPRVMEVAMILKATSRRARMPDGGPMQGIVDGVVTDPHDLGEEQGNYADGQAADHRLQVFREFQLVFKQLLAPVEGFYKGKGHCRAQKSQDEIKEQLPVAFQQIGGYLKGGEVALELMGDDGGHDRRDDNRRQLGKAEIAEDDFHREQSAGHRRIEGRRNSGRSPAADKGFHALGGDPEKLADGRTEAGADLDDRPFTPHRSPRADGDGGGQGP